MSGVRPGRYGVGEQIREMAALFYYRRTICIGITIVKQLYQLIEESLEERGNHQPKRSRS